MSRTLLSLTLACFVLLASGQVSFKNTGSSKIFVAICYNDAATGWTTKGWYSIEPNEEKSLYNYTATSNPNFYYCAKIEGCVDMGFYGETPLYVNTQKGFTISNADRAGNFSDALVQKYKFRQISLKGRTTYPIELQPINLTCGGQPQGKWRLSLDKEGDYAEKKEDAVYYREITFDKGRSLGWCKDYYPDGKVKAEFKLASYRPVVYEGKCTWYKLDGSIEREATYKDGTLITSIAYDAIGQTVTKQTRYKVVELPLQEFVVNSTSNETWHGGHSKIIYPVSLPDNTTEWYYEFAASRDDNNQKQNVQRVSLATQLSSLIDKTGLLSATVGMLTPPPGADICNIYLMDGKYYDAFNAGKEFRYNAIGSRENFKSGIVQVRGARIVNPIIGIKNPDVAERINVSIRVVAIVATVE